MEELEGRLDAHAHVAMVRAARDARFNMLRVWGGGMVLPDAFYDACDRYGLLVYHDMPYAQVGILLLLNPSLLWRWQELDAAAAAARVPPSLEVALLPLGIMPHPWLSSSALSSPSLPTLPPHPFP